MTPPANVPSSFHFELSANGENTSFESVEGISTEVALRHIIQDGENPFKFRLPSPPKNRQLVFKNGSAPQGSKLLQWCAACAQEDGSSHKNQVAVRLKDNHGKSYVEWTFYSAMAVNNNTSQGNSKKKDTQIDDLELSYSFYTVNKQ